MDKILSADPYDKTGSFVNAGYTLKESSDVGLEAGNKILFFKTESQETVNKLTERLKPIESLKELKDADKEKVIKTIEDEENNAAAGFGNIFG